MFIKKSSPTCRRNQSRSYFAFVLYIVSLILPSNTWAANRGAKTLYVSTTYGRSDNLGITAVSPCLSIKKALSVNPDTILLKAGDVFYENLNLSNVVLSRYGDGPNPCICGFRSIPKNSWHNEGDNIWSLSLIDIQGVGFQVKGSSLLNNIGCFYERKVDAIHGGKVQLKNQLKKNWDFWQTDKFSKDINPAEFDKVYLYLDKNPNLYDLECSVGTNGMIVSNAQVVGVNVMGFGFGIVGCSNTVIRNCKIDVIGGMILLGYHKFAPYGNGIEFNLSKHSCENCLVEDCMISRTYDSGLTIQASKKADAVPRNIVIRNNLIYRCCQGWEDYLQNPNPQIRYYDCSFEYNIVLDSGYSGFNYPDSRVNNCCILGYNTKGNKGMLIKRNTFIGGNFYCSTTYNSEYKSNVWEGNICYLSEGSYILSSHDGKKNVLRMTGAKKNDEETVAIYEILTGDTTTSFEIKRRGAIKRVIKKEYNRFLLSHSY